MRNIGRFLALVALIALPASSQKPESDFPLKPLFGEPGRFALEFGPSTYGAWRQPQVIIVHPSTAHLRRYVKSDVPGPPLPPPKECAHTACKAVFCEGAAIPPGECCPRCPSGRSGGPWLGPLTMPLEDREKKEK